MKLIAFAVLLIAIIFAQTVIIIDQEFRIKQLRNKVNETVERIEFVLSEFDYLGSEASSTEKIYDGKNNAGTSTADKTY